MVNINFEHLNNSSVCFIGFTTVKSEPLISSLLNIAGDLTNNKISRLYFDKDDIDTIEDNSNIILDQIKSVKEKNFDFIIISSKVLLKAFCPSMLRSQGFMQYIGALPQYSDELGKSKIIVVNDSSNMNSKNAEEQEDWMDILVTGLRVERNSYNIDIKFIRDYDDFVSSCNYMKSLENEIIGYDIETNAGQVYTSSSYCTIIGLCSSIPNSDKDVKAFYYVTDRGFIPDNIKDLLRQFFDNTYKRVWTYNASMEIKWTDFLLGKFYHFQDARILVNMYGIRGSLKNVAKKELQVPSWELTVHDFIADISVIFNEVKSLETKTEEDFIPYLKTANFKELEKVFLTSKKYLNIVSKYNEMCVTWSKEQVDDALSYYPSAWASVPKDILGTYCAYDTAYTVLLVKKFGLTEMSKPYNIYIRHPWLASKFEISGVPWDDNAATKVLDESYDRMLSLLFDLIQYSDISEEEKLQAKTIYHSQLPYDIISYTEKKNIERKKPVTTKAEKLTHLKTILNLGSNTRESRDKFWNAYLTDEIKLSGMLLLFIENIELNQTYNTKFKQALGIEYNMYNNVEETFDKIIHIQERTLDKGLSRAISNSISYAYENIENYLYRYEKNAIKFHYNILTKFFNVDINNEDTWNDKFKMLFDLFYFKKLDKMLTYINRNLGRESVWYSKLNKDNIPIRISNYFDNKHIDDYDLMVLNTDFNVLGADTTRWNAGWHTSPPSSPSRRCFVTRNDKQIWVHADYSQAELVMLAVMSGDQRMIQSFVDGKDMHQFTASEVYKIPYDSVTSLQRKSAKGVNFGIVYGKSLESLAVDITHGNIKEAQELLDTVFSTFPLIEKFIKDKHNQLDELGYVTTYFGNRIYIDTTTRGNEKYRQAVNYPIQGSSSTIAGTAMFNFIDFCEKKGYNINPIGFTHDALDFLCDVDQMFDILDIMIYKLQEEIREKAKIPLRIDFEISVDSFNLCHFSMVGDKMTLKGSEEGVSKLIERLSNSTTFIIESTKEISRELKKSSWEDMFTNGTALNDDWGKVIYEVEKELCIKKR